MFHILVDLIYTAKLAQLPQHTKKKPLRSYYKAVKIMFQNVQSAIGQYYKPIKLGRVPIPLLQKTAAIHIVAVLLRFTYYYY